MISHSLPGDAPPAVAVLGGDPVIGKAIEAMLLDAGYSAIAFAVPPVNGSRHLLDGAQVLLFAPGADAEEREAFLENRTGTPILELVTVLDRASGGQSGSIPWPTGVEEIVEEVDSILSAANDKVPFA